MNVDEHPFSIFNKAKRVKKHERMSDDQKRHEIQKFLSEVAKEDTCWNLCTKRKACRMKCSCLKSLKESQICRDAVGEYMLEYSKKSWNAQGQVLITWLRYTKEERMKRGNVRKTNEPYFYMPYVLNVDGEISDEDEEAINALSTTKVCRNALALLLNFRESKWKQCDEHERAGTLPVHGSRYNKNRSQKVMALKPVLDEFLKISSNWLNQDPLKWCGTLQMDWIRQMIR